jgi:hypothetical protein
MVLQRAAREVETGPLRLAKPSAAEKKIVPLREARKWEIDLSRRELRAHRAPVPIGSRAFDILEVLAVSIGELVSKDELMARVWPSVIVEENTLQVHMSALRKALGPDRGMVQADRKRARLSLGWRLDDQVGEDGGTAGCPGASLLRCAANHDQSADGRIRTNWPSQCRAAITGSAVRLSGGDADRPRRYRKNDACFGRCP